METSETIAIGTSSPSEELDTTAAPAIEYAPQFWANVRQVAVQFATEGELDAAIDSLWEQPEWRVAPRVHVGNNTMIVPEQLVDYFRSKAYHFTLTKVVSAGELSCEEVNRIRSEGRMSQN